VTQQPCPVQEDSSHGRRSDPETTGAHESGVPHGGIDLPGPDETLAIPAGPPHEITKADRRPVLHRDLGFIDQGRAAAPKDLGEQGVATGVGKSAIEARLAQRRSGKTEVAGRQAPRLTSTQALVLAEVGDPHHPPEKRAAVDHSPTDDRHLVFLDLSDQRLQPVSRRDAIGIDEGDDVARAPLDPQVSRDIRSLVGLADQLDAGEELPYDIGRAVGAAVVDDDNLGLGRLYALGFE